MPIYEFFCASCDRTYEFDLPMTAEKPTDCEVCGFSLRRIWTPVDIHFNGEGFTRKTGRNAAGEPIISRKN